MRLIEMHLTKAICAVLKPWDLQVQYDMTPTRDEVIEKTGSDSWTISVAYLQEHAAARKTVFPSNPPFHEVVLYAHERRGTGQPSIFDLFPTSLRQRSHVIDLALQSQRMMPDPESNQ